MMRVDKLLSLKGLGSRKEVKALLKQGLITVNEKVVKDPGFLISAEKDEIKREGKLLSYETFCYLMLHKPKGVISAVSDPKQKTVMDLVPKIYYQKDLFPVGRLDKDTEGLLLLTNDGDLAHRLLSPKKHVFKRYQVMVDKPLTEDLILAFEEGVLLARNERCKASKLHILSETLCQVEICEGKFHQIKRMFGAYGYGVIYLKRLSMGPLLLDESLPKGGVRPLWAEEIEALKK